MTIIFSIIVFIITIFILKDTYIKEYYSDLNGNIKLIDTHKWNITPLQILLLLLVSFIPILNLLSYTIFYIIFIMRSLPLDHPCGEYKFSVLYVEGNNFVTKTLKRIGKFFKNIWKLLNTPI